MKKLATTLIATTLIASALTADSAVVAKKVSSKLANVTSTSSVWKKASFADVTLYPQTTIKMNDKKANELNANNKALKAKIAAVYNGSNIAFLIKWPDGSKSIQQGYKTDSYADGFAVQFASKYSNAAELPYIGMGSDGREVVIHLQKATSEIWEPNGNGNVGDQVNPNQTNLFNKDLENFNKNVKKIGVSDYQRSFVSEGFRSMTEIKDGSAKASMDMNYGSNGWSGTLSRSLKDEYLNLNSAVIPVAFAVWDGDKMGRNGLKYLSSWTAVELKGKKGSKDLLSALSGKTKGDAAKGKDAVAANCSACHQITPTDAPNLMGPSLTNIGGYATVDYIKESLIKPSAVVVPGYNRNAHSNYAWYNLDNGKRVSAMPDFSWMSPAEINDMVAYLKTLKAEAK